MRKKITTSLEDIKKSPKVRMLLKILGFNSSSPSFDNQAILKSILHYYDTIFLHMPQNVYCLDTEGKGLICNQNVLDSFGFSSMEDFVGLDFERMAKLAKWDPKTMESFRKDVLDVVATGKPRVDIAEPPIPGPKGNMVYFLTTKVPVFDDAGKVISVVGISTDITQQKATQDNLKIALQKSEEANKTKQEFLHNMRHDIRTPFSGILGISQALALSETDPEKKELLSCIADSSEQLLEFLNKILEHIKTESHDIPVLSKPFDLKEVIDDVIKINKPIAMQKGLTLSVILSPDFPQEIISDSFRIKRILLDLVSNSVKFTDKGGATISAELKKHKEYGTLLKLTVKDTGIGMPEEKSDYVFETFNRLTSSYSGVYKGIGLGLKTVKQFTEELGGQISIKSVLDKGTTTVLALPIQLPLLNRMVEN